MSDAYREGLEARGLEDVQPLYRQLLRRLRSQDPAVYEEAVSRYHEEIEPAAAASDDPVAAWIDYGIWLARRIAPGRTLCVDPGGRAEPADPPPPPGCMLIHLPEDTRSRGFLLAMPAAATPAQRETAALLCD